MNTITYNVPNINCNHCVHTIKMELSELIGVKSVEADPSTKKVKIEFELPATAENIEKALESINYPVKK
jgi:copper chaperone